MVRIDMEKGCPVDISVSGDCDEIAGQVTAAVGVIYALLGGAKTNAGKVFRSAISSMLADDARIWDESPRAKLNGRGCSVVFDPQMELEE